MSPETKPLKLLHIFPTFRVGGAQVRFTTIANYFGTEFHHQIFAMDGEYECLAKLAPGLMIGLPKVLVHKGHTLNNRRHFRVALRTIRPDFLITYNWGSIEWAMANWPPLVRHIHIEDGFGPEEAHGQLPRRIWVRRLVLRRSTIVLPSLTLQRIALSEWRLNARRLRYIPNGIDCARFSDPAMASSFSDGDSLCIGTVSALRKEKNLSRLIEAFYRASQHIACRLIIVGDGPERPILEALVSKLELKSKVQFKGHATNPIPFYHEMDIFALSSDTEQMPYTIIEAMAVGLPIAATDVGDIAQMVAPNNRPYVVQPNADALAAAIRSLLQDPTSRQAIGISNKVKAQTEFDQAKMLAAYGALFGRQDLISASDTSKNVRPPDSGPKIALGNDI